MENEIQTTQRRALSINLDQQRYGTFAEIGAGQEVARHFFQAGKASNTIAKTMSAYDKTFSDYIYGQGSRFVSRARLISMLDHEFSLLMGRLHSQRGSDSSFFTLANTVATTNHEDNPTCHAWMGVRFQAEPMGEPNEIILHVRMLDRFRLRQQETLGILGVNLLFSAFYLYKTPEKITHSLMENLSNDRLEIDFIDFQGKDLQHIDNRSVSLDLLKNDLTKVVLISPENETLQVSDHLYNKNLLIQRGTFRPITNANLEIMKQGLLQFKNQKNSQAESSSTISILEISLTELDSNNPSEQSDFLDRLETLTQLGHHIMVSNCPLFYQLKTTLRRYTDGSIAMIMGALLLDKIFHEKYYAHLNGGILEALGQLFDDKSFFYIYPYFEDGNYLTAKTFTPNKNLAHLYSYLLEKNKLIDILECKEVVSQPHSQKIRDLMLKDDPRWEEYVPTQVKKLIKLKKLFKYTHNE